MTKKLTYIHWTISLLYLVLNFKKIRGAFRSEVWSKEIDLVNHVTNYSAHLQVISILLVLGSFILLGAYIRRFDVSNYILVPIEIMAIILFINTRIDFSRWIEINIFGGGGLLAFTCLLAINFIWLFTKRSVVQA